MSGQKFTLSFTKKIEKKNLQPSVIHNDTPQEAKEKTENIESIEDNVLKTDGKEETTELVIPLVTEDRITYFRRLAEKKKLEKEKEKAKLKEEVQDDKVSSKNNADKDEVAEEDEKPLTLEEQAEAAVLEETKKKLEDWTERTATTSNLSIAVAINTENEEPLVTKIGKESSLDEYDKVDVSHFGAALLRGMGWQKSEGIGSKSKQVVEIIDPSAKSFGLSGNKSGKGVNKDKIENEEELQLAKGSHVFIHSGRHRGTYGTVESLDEDHLLVRTAMGQEVLREVEFNVKAVSKKEYKDSSRVINKDMYDKYKEEEARKKESKKKKASYSDDSDNSNQSRANESKDVDLKTEKEKVNKQDRKDERKEKVSKDPESSEILKTGNNNRVELQQEEQILKKDRKYKDDEWMKEHYKSKEDSSQRTLDSRSKYEDSSRRTDDRYNSKGYKNQDVYQRKSSKYDSKDDKYTKDKGSLHQMKEKDKYYEQRLEDKYYSSDTSSKHLSKRDSDREDLRTTKRIQQERSEDSFREIKKIKKTEERRPVIPWVRENLRVRLINKSYKGGRYHKEKVIVRSVDTAESCECVTSEGKVLREVHPEWLETVIPKVHPQIIMIVKGQHKGQRGRILELHRDQEKASLQLFDDASVILKLHYDDICEYAKR